MLLQKTFRDNGKVAGDTQTGDGVTATHYELKHAQTSGGAGQTLQPQHRRTPASPLRGVSQS